MRSDCVIQQSTIVVYMGISHFLSIAEGNFRFVQALQAHAEFP